MGEETTYSVLVVDDQVLYREGVAEAIDRWPNFNVIGQAANGYEAVEFCKSHTPDLVLMDIMMPVMDGIEATRRIFFDNPQIKTVMLTVSEEKEHIFASFRSGAHGYLLKNLSITQLKARLEGIAEGEAVISASAADALFREFARVSTLAATKREHKERPGVILTYREKQILSLLALGLSNEEIGMRLYVSTATIKKQLSTLMQKLFLENRVQAAVFAVKEGLDEQAF